MSAKILVLYPPPLDPASFERDYFSQHMPLMRRLLQSSTRTPTFRVVSGADIYYRVSEVQFDCLEELQAFVSSHETRQGRESSEAVSTGGRPIYLICEADETPS